MPGAGIGNVLLIILYLILILVGAYFATRAVGKYAMQRGMKKKPRGSGARAPVLGERLSVVDRIPVDRDKSVLVVEFQEHFYLLGSTSQELRLIDKVPISDDELKERAQKSEDVMSGQMPDEGVFKRFCENMRGEFRKRTVGKVGKTGQARDFGKELTKELTKDNEDKRDA